MTVSSRSYLDVTSKLEMVLLLCDKSVVDWREDEPFVGGDGQPQHRKLEQVLGEGLVPGVLLEVSEADVGRDLLLRQELLRLLQGQNVLLLQVLLCWLQLDSNCRMAFVLLFYNGGLEFHIKIIDKLQFAFFSQRI